MVLLYSVFMITLFSCQDNQKCGAGKISDRKVEFYICDKMFNTDTIKTTDNRWFDQSDFWDAKEGNAQVSDSWLGGFDTIAFKLPDGYKIIEVKRSFVITPSIWAKLGDEVTQFKDFDDLKVVCDDPNMLMMKDNMLVNGTEVDDQTISELYFRHKQKFNKNEIESLINNDYERSVKYINTDESSTASQKNKYLLENKREKDIYIGYLKNYTNWENASKDQFQLLAKERYLTLTIQNKDKTHKITLYREAIYGN